mmetsp:Transcript_57546/g.169042  ORF Transcript_57546/g.169042 Transcript_57546/m.169042 type:complete len:295 (+) Transcript_57546:1402-2286(+)
MAVRPCARRLGVIGGEAVWVDVAVELGDLTTHVLLDAQLPQADGAQDHATHLRPDEARVPREWELALRELLLDVGDVWHRLRVLREGLLDKVVLHPVPEGADVLHPVQAAAPQAVAARPVLLLVRSGLEDIWRLELVDVEREEEEEQRVEEGLTAHDLEVAVLHGGGVVDPINVDVLEILPEHGVAHEAVLVSGLLEDLLQRHHRARLLVLPNLLVDRPNDGIARLGRLRLLVRLLVFRHHGYCEGDLLPRALAQAAAKRAASVVRALSRRVPRRPALPLFPSPGRRGGGPPRS